MDYSAYYQQQQQNYDPSSSLSSSQFYQHPTNNSYDYSSYDYSYHNHHQGYNAVQQPQHEELEPNPPGVTAAQNSYYQYPLPVAPATLLNAGLHYQPLQIVHPQEIPQSQPQAHSGPRPNAFNNRPFRGRGRGRGRGSGRGRGRGRGRAQSLHRPTQDQTIYPEGAAHVQGWAPQPMPQDPAPPIPPKVLRCEVCKIGCDTVEIFEQHKNGKKHQKNLKKIAIGVQMEMPSNSNVASEIPFQPNQVEENVNVLGWPGQPLPLNVQGQPRSAHVPSKAVSCELCNVDCNTAEIFEKHKNGKKHKKKLKAHEDLQRRKSVTPFVQAEQTSTSEVPRLEVPSRPEKIDGPGDPQSKEETLSRETNKEENKVEAEKQIAEETGPTEQKSAEKVNVDTSEGRGSGFKRKMRGGNGGRRTRPCNRSKKPMDSSKPKEAVPLICELCNVKCESQVVFQSHLVGKKHQLKAKRFLTPHEILGQEILAALTPALQGLLQQNAIASTSMGPPLHNQGFGPFGPLLGGLAQNFFNAEASASGANMKNLSQLQSLSADNIAPHLVNTEGKSYEGNPESQRGEIYYPAGSLVVEQTEHIASGTANGAFGVEKSVGFEPLAGPGATTEQNLTKGGDSAQ